MKFDHLYRAVDDLLDELQKQKQTGVVSAQMANARGHLEDSRGDWQQFLRLEAATRGTGKSTKMLVGICSKIQDQSKSPVVKENEIIIACASADGVEHLMSIMKELCPHFKMTCVSDGNALHVRFRLWKWVLKFEDWRKLDTSRAAMLFVDHSVAMS